MENKVEIWKDISGYEGKYQVSNLGRVKSLERTIVFKPTTKRNGYSILKKGKILKIFNNKDTGYNSVCLCLKNKKTTFLTHRLIALAFIPNPDNLPEVNHKNSIRNDNYLENLEWVSFIENNCHNSNKRRKTSKFIGVSFDRNAKKWRAKINLNGKSIYLGYYNDEEIAFQARKKYEIENEIKNKYLTNEK